MSVSLNPSNSLGFRRPLTTLVKRSLTITNNNSQPVAFKVKTTAPKLYCVRPNSGRVEPGESVEVSVMLQALKEEPPLNTKCKDKFLIQSTVITPEKETMSLADIWASPDLNEEGKVFQQKLRVTYLPAEGQIDEEDEGVSVIQHNESMNMSIAGNGHPQANGHPAESHYVNAPVEHHDDRAHTPVQDMEREASHESAAPTEHQVPIIVEPPSQPSSQFSAPTEPAHEPEPQYASEPTAEPSAAPAPVPEPARAPSPIPVPPPASVPAPEPAAAPAAAPEPIIITKENPVNEELYAKLQRALEEIDRLKNEITQLSSPAAQELRRRTRKLSDADSYAGSDVQTAVEEPPFQQEGVPLQIVVIIALGVFVTTYLFF